MGHDLESFRRVRASQSQPWEPSQTVPHLPRHALYSPHFCCALFLSTGTWAPLAGKPRGGLSPFFMTSCPFRSNAWRCCERLVRLFFFLSFSTADHSLLSDLPPLRLASPSPRVALASSCRCPIATRRPHRVVSAALPPRHAPPRRVAPCHASSSSHCPLPRVTLVALPLATRPLVALPLATRHPRRVAPRHAPLVALRAVLWGKWRGSSEWVGRGECELGVV